MKKRNIIAIGCLTMMLGLGAFAGGKIEKVERVIAGDDNAGWGTAYVHGNWDGSNWTDKALEYNAYNNRYEVTVTVKAGVQFLFYGGTNVWVKRNWAGITSKDTWTRFTDNQSDNFKFKYDGTYTLSVDRWVVQEYHDDPSYGCHIEDGYVYFFSEGDVDTNRRIYTYGSGEFYGGFGTTYVTGVSEQVSGVVNYNGSYQKIYRVPICRSLTTHMIFSDDYNNQSSDLAFANKTGYFWTGGSGASNSDDGAAIDFITHVEALRNDSTYKGKANSLCGISAASRSAILTAYNGLTPSAKSKVNSSTTKTWKSASSSDERNWTFAEIITELDSLDKVSNANSNFAIDFNNTNALANMVTIVLSITTVATSAGFLFLKKKKEI